MKMFLGASLLVVYCSSLHEHKIPSWQEMACLVTTSDVKCCESRVAWQPQSCVHVVHCGSLNLIVAWNCLIRCTCKDDIDDFDARHTMTVIHCAGKHYLVTHNCTYPVFDRVLAITHHLHWRGGCWSRCRLHRCSGCGRTYVLFVVSIPSTLTCASRLTMLIYRQLTLFWVFTNTITKYANCYFLSLWLICAWLKKVISFCGLTFFSP